jgi:hypothetical protein
LVNRPLSAQKKNQAVNVADGFLGRWSQRKQAVREGKPLEEPPAPAPVLASPSAATTELHSSNSSPKALTQKAPPPTLKEVELLTQASDFSPFMARDVTPDVRNAAMKKLFTDPHYNVMDQLDIYIDDYTKSDPIPQAMLRQMVGAEFLNLFENESQEDKSVKKLLPTGPADTTNTPPPDKSLDHDHTDLRLQPNHAPGRQAFGRSTE